MFRVEASVKVDRPIDQVFGLVSDPAKIPLWQSEVVKSTVLDPGPARLGTRFTEVVRFGPWKMETVCEIIAFEPHRRMGFKARSRALGYEGVFVLEPVEGGTLVSVTGKAQMNGGWRLVEWMLAAEVKKGIADELGQLKKYIESPAGAGSRAA
jgi:uncharacterized membrane protein